MPRTSKPLTVNRIRNAKPADFPLWDGGGLYLISRNGRLHWRMKYTRPDGRENRLALGGYPEVTLKAARQLRDEARRKLANGIDPVAEKKAQRMDATRARRDTFERFARQWLEIKSKGWADATRNTMTLCVETYLVPAIGKHSVRDLTSAEVVRVLRRLNDHAPALTRKAAQVAQATIRLAIAEGAREDGRVLDLNLRDNLPARKRGHYAAATLPAEMGDVLRTIKDYPHPVTRAALMTCAYMGQRPGTVAAMRWDEVNSDEWCIPGEKMKMHQPHIVPIPRQMAALLETMRQFSTGEYVFPPLAKQKTPHLHRDALSKALRALGLRGKQTPHGLRASLRTLARERLGVAVDVLEAQLAHAKKDQIAAAYDRTKFDDERHQVMQAWADYLDGLRDGAQVLPFRRKA